VCAEEGDPAQAEGPWLRQKKNPSTRLLSQIPVRAGSPKSPACRKGEKTVDAGFCRKLRLAGSPLNQQGRKDAVVEEEKSEHQAFVTNPAGNQST